ncbi:HigA family addiction module antitoxin [Pseudomonas sp. B21-040]|nr:MULTISPECIES: HigA family addiction module antitoxin [Pseudomonas]KJZ36445.1 addiction module antidote protein HigA [Pseudomonas fluorescens]OOG12904.1 addiction module antidote protein, HigA family [Pseudomonas sp. C9]UVL40299.1 HigA family addiction module antitoxin [Pseudomonas sp. B21-040]
MNTNGMRPIHPGEILEKEFLEPWGISVADLQGRVRMSPFELRELMAQNIRVGPELAKKLSIHLNTTIEFWLNLQSTHDVRIAEIGRG